MMTFYEINSSLIKQTKPTSNLGEKKYGSTKLLYIEDLKLPFSYQILLYRANNVK